MLHVHAVMYPTSTKTCSYTEEEIEQKVADLRAELTQTGYDAGSYRSSGGGGGDSHQMAEAAQKKNEQLRAAFGIRQDYVDGSAFAFGAMKAAREEEKLQQE